MTTTLNKKVELVDLEQQPIGWVKQSGSYFTGITFTDEPPDNTWKPIYFRAEK